MSLPLWFAGFVQKKIRFLQQQYLISVAEDLLTNFYERFTVFTLLLSLNFFVFDNTGAKIITDQYINNIKIEIVFITF